MIVSESRYALFGIMLKRLPHPLSAAYLIRMARGAIDRLRAICLALPEAREKEAWGDPTFRVRDRIFAMYKIGDGRKSLWCKAPRGSQEILVNADPRTFYVPPYVG